MTARRLTQMVVASFLGPLFLSTLCFGCERDSGHSVSAAPEPPRALVGSTKPCASSSPSARRAVRLEREGRMRIERYPYDQTDGVRGTFLLLEATDCYRAAGLVSAASRAGATARRFATVLEADYAAARVAIEHSLSKKRWSDVRQQVQRLLALTAHMHPSPYVDWLRAIAALANSHDES